MVSSEEAEKDACFMSETLRSTEGSPVIVAEKPMVSSNENRIFEEAGKLLYNFSSFIIKNIKRDTVETVICK